MIWIFGLITGLVFDMPQWWWFMGLVMAVLAHPPIQITFPLHKVSKDDTLRKYKRTGRIFK